MYSDTTKFKFRFRNISKFIINLEKDTARLSNTIQELKKIKLDYRFTVWKACDSKHAQLNFYNYISKAAYQNIISPVSSSILPNYSAVGCAISHIEIWKHVVNNNIKESWIIEDDIHIKDTTMFYLQLKNISHFIKKHENSKIFISMNSRIHKDFAYKPYFFNKLQTNKYNLLCIKKPITWMHFYYVNKQMCRFLLKKLTYITYQIDIELGMLATREMYNDKNNSVFMYASNDNIIQNKKFVSNIQFYQIRLTELIYIFKNILNYNIVKIIHTYIPNLYKT